MINLTRATPGDEVMDFYKPSFDEAAKYKEYFKQCLQMCAEMSFLALWSCNEKLNVARAFYQDLFWQQADWQNERIWLPPVGEWNRPDWAELFAEVVPPGTVFGFVPEILALRWRRVLGERLSVTEMRSEWDYMYNIEQEVLLEGRSFANVRRLCRRFMENYPENIYSEITPEDIPALTAFQYKWMDLNEKAGKMNDDLLAEHREALKILENWALLSDVLGGKITVNGEIISYIVVELLDDYIISGHILKGNYAYVGVYQAMRHLFFKNSLQNISIVNGWGDGGYENLRQAKLNMNPIGYIKKYVIIWN